MNLPSLVFTLEFLLIVPPLSPFSILGNTYILNFFFPPVSTAETLQDATGRNSRIPNRCSLGKKHVWAILYRGILIVPPPP